MEHRSCVCSPLFYIWDEEGAGGKWLFFLVFKLLDPKEPHVNQMEMTEHHPGLLAGYSGFK